MPEESTESIVSGYQLPPFDGKTLFSKKAHNLRNLVLNALLNMRIIQGSRDEVHISRRNIIIEYVGTPPQTAPLVINARRFKSMANDYLICHSWDGTLEGGTAINVAKPSKLRFSITAETIGGDPITYSSYSTATQTRSATDGVNTENQMITPNYLVNDVIYTMTAPTFATASGVPITELDLNIDARAWSAY